MSAGSPKTSKMEVTQDLEGAFELFVEASKALESQQLVLQAQLGELSKELVEANARLSSLLNSLPAGVVLVENGIVIDFNPAAQHFIPELERLAPWSTPKHWKASNGPGQFLVSTENTQQYLQLEEVQSGLRSVIQIQDITSAIANHAEKERVDRLAAMGKMSAGIAHQLRTPLSTALLYASHLSDASISEEQKHTFAQRLKTQLMNLEKLAGNMLLFIKERPKQLSPVPVDTLLNEACEAIGALCESQNITLKRDFQSAGIVINVEKQSMVSALVAILENALQVTQSGQIIEISSKSLPGRVQIVIDDQGPGIAPDMMDTLFEPFSTSRITGTGLGLSIARTAIESHRGEIAVSNRDGGGARFTITLPSLTEL